MPKDDTDLAQLDIARYVKPGDNVMWGQMAGEPVPLVEKLLEQRHDIGRFSAFMGSGVAGVVRPEHADVIHFRSYGGLAGNRLMSRAGCLDNLPVHLSAMPALIRSGAIRADVVLVQLTERDDGDFDYALLNDYIVDATERARIVIGEVNEGAPRVRGMCKVRRDRIDCLVRTRRSPVVLPVAETADEVSLKIAEHTAELIEDGANIQTGIGLLPNLICSRLTGHRDLGVYSGMISDSVMALVESGAFSGKNNIHDPGCMTTGIVAGSRRLYEFIDGNPIISLRTAEYTHHIAKLGQVPRLVSINSAIEVDLTGQVSSEVVGSTNIGAVGGAVDYVRAANCSEGGLSAVVLPSTVEQGTKSRIVANLGGPTTIARSDVDVVVTEYGSVRLKGLSAIERARALVGIAHPCFQEALSAKIAEVAR